MTEKPTIEQLIDDVKNHQDWRVRKQSIHQLGEYDTTEAMDAIATALYDDSPHVVQAATFKLPQYGSNGIPALLGAITSTKDNSNRRFMILALRKIADSIVIPTLLECLNDADSQIRWAASDVLKELPYGDGLEAIISLSKRSSGKLHETILEVVASLGKTVSISDLTYLIRSDEIVARHYASMALARGRPDGYFDILHEASFDTRADVRYSAAEGLGSVGDDRSFKRLVEMIQDEADSVKLKAAEELTRIDRVRAKHHLIMMRDNPDQKIQAFLKSAVTDLDVIPKLLDDYRNDDMHSGDALFGFARKHWDYPKRGEQAVAEALKDLNSDNQNLRIAATWLLYAYTYELWYALMDWNKAGNSRSDFKETALQSRTIDVLIELLVDQNDDIRLSALEPIMRIGDLRATENLIKCLTSDDSLIVQQAARCLATIKDKRAIQPLLEALNEADDVTRNRIMSALSAIGGDEALQALIQLLEHPHDRTRGIAAFDLGKTGDKRATPILIEKLGEETEDAVREWMIIGLGYLSDKRATQTIIDLLNNPRTDNPRFLHILRDKAIHALLTIRDDASLPTLYNEVNSAKEWQVRMTATSAIGAIGTPRERANRLFELLEHDHETVRTTAAKDLGYLGARTDDLELRDYIVNNLIQRLQDIGAGYHALPTVAHMAAKSLYYVGTPEANEALRNWELKRASDNE